MADHTAHRDGIRAAFATHSAYQPDATAFALTTTPFDVRVTVNETGDDANDRDATDNHDDANDRDASDSNHDADDETPNPDVETGYRVRIRVPTLDSVTEEHVADAVAEGWLDTFTLRLADAPSVTRSDVSVPEPSVQTVGTEIVVTFEFAHTSPRRAAAVAKTLAEYVEGTYAEGVIPGYTYESPVADLLSRARTQGTNESDDDGSDDDGSDDDGSGEDGSDDDGSDGDTTGGQMPM